MQRFFLAPPEKLNITDLQAIDINNHNVAFQESVIRGIENRFLNGNENMKIA